MTSSNPNRKNNTLLDEGDDVELNVVNESDDEDLENIDSNSENDDDEIAKVLT